MLALATAACSSPAVETWTATLHLRLDAPLPIGSSAWVVEQDESALVGVSFQTGEVRVVARVRGSEVLPGSPAHVFDRPPSGESVRVDSVAVVDIEPDGDDEVLLHGHTSPAAYEMLWLFDPEDESLSRLVSIEQAGSWLDGLDTNLRATFGAPADASAVLALWRFSIVDGGAPSAQNAFTAYALTRAQIARWREVECSGLACPASTRIGREEDVLVLGGLEADARDGLRAYYTAPGDTAVHEPSRWHVRSVTCRVVDESLECDPSSDLATLGGIGDGPSAFGCDGEACGYATFPSTRLRSAEALTVIEPDVAPRGSVPGLHQGFLPLVLREDALVAVGLGYGEVHRITLRRGSDAIASRISFAEPDEAFPALLRSSPDRRDERLLRVATAAGEPHAFLYEIRPSLAAWAD